MGFKNARMSCHGVVMVAGNDRMTEGSIIWDIDPSLVSKDSSIIVPVREAGVKVGRDFARECMECIEYKRVRCRGRAELVGERSINKVDEQCIGEEGNGLIVCICRGYVVQLARKGIWGTKILTRNVFKGKVKFSKVK